MSKTQPAHSDTKTLTVAQIAVLCGLTVDAVYTRSDAAGIQTSARLPRAAFKNSGVSARYLRTEVQPVIDAINAKRVRREERELAARQRIEREAAAAALLVAAQAKPPAETPPAAPAVVAAPAPVHTIQPELFDEQRIQRQLAELQLALGRIEERMLDRQDALTVHLEHLLRSHNSAILRAIEGQVGSVGALLSKAAGKAAAEAGVH